MMNAWKVKRKYFPLVAIIIFALIACFTPYLGLQDPTQVSNATLTEPSFEHWLGTNDIGQDIFSRLLYGARTSVVTSLMVGFISVAFSLVVGVFSGLKGGAFDRLILRVTDVFLALPELMVCLLVASIIKPTQFGLIIMMSVLIWPVSMKLIRAQVLIEKQSDYIHFARNYGGSDFYIMYHHILPSIMPLIISMFIRNATMAVFMESSLAFLGLLNPDTISWGRMIADAMPFSYLPIWKNWLLPTGMMLSMFILSLLLVGAPFDKSRFKERT